MSTPIGSYTYNNLIGTIRLRLKMFNAEKYPKLAIRDDIYRAICELSEISGTKDDAIFRGSQIIPLSKGVTSNSTAGVYYTIATRKITVPLYATNPDNVWVNDADGFDSTWEGALVTFVYDDGSGGSGPNGLVQKSIYIAASPATGVCTVSSPATDLLLPVGFFTGTFGGATVAIRSLTVVMSSTAAADIVDISNISDYKYLNKITAIEDSVSGPCSEMDEKSFRAIKAYVDDENVYKDEIIWYRHGSMLYFCKNSVTAYGTRTMFYTRFPIKPTTYTEYVDYPDTQWKLLIDACVITILIALKVEVPQDLQSTVSKINAMRESTNEQIMKANAKANTQ